MRIQKTVLLILCCLLLAFAAACGGGGSAGENENVGEQNGEGDNADSGDGDQVGSDNPNATPEMEFDMGGKTIRLVSWYDETIGGDDPDGIKRKENLEALMEKHNFNVEFIQVDYSELADKARASLIAGDPIGEIIRLARPWMIPALTNQDLFWPLDEYVTNDNAFRLQYTHVMSAHNGKGYGFRIGSEGAASGIVYNRTLMNNLGMKPLQDYVDEDNWTWETFIQVAKEANRDTDNDGRVDTWGLSTNNLIIPSFAANDAALVSEGKQNLEDPKTLETLNFLSRLATEGVARPPESGSQDEPTQFFLEGNTLMTPGQDYTYNELQTAMEDYELGFLPFPKGPSAGGYRTLLTIPNYYTIPRAVENPEQIIYIWEKIHDIESIYDYRQQAAYETFFHNEVDLNNALMAVEVINIVEQDGYYPNMKFSEFVGELRDGVSVSTVIDKYKATFQSAVDEVWGQ